MSDPVLIRQLAPGDLAYVFSTWLRDLRDADGGPLDDSEWYPAHRAAIERVLADKNTVALVAAAADKPEEILGYVVAEPNEVLWWVTIRKPLRERGLAKRLLEAANVPPGTPAAWSTASSRARLKNPPRGRKIRSRQRAESTGRPSKSSGR